jgi:hypothetical protein
MVRILRSLLQRLKRCQGSTPGCGDPEVPGDLDHDDLSWFDPPSDPNDVEGWNQCWGDQLGHGIVPPLFDMFSDDRRLIEVMVEEGLSTILCARNGISMEPRALAAAGFKVVALD